MDSLSVLQRLGTQRFIGKLSAALAEVCTEVARTRNKGKVTVTFTVSPGAGHDLGVVVMEEIKRAPPVDEPHGAFFYAVDGELHDSDPRQPQMQFEVVPPSNGDVRTVAPPTTVKEA